MKWRKYLLLCIPALILVLELLPCGVVRYFSNGPDAQIRTTAPYFAPHFGYALFGPVSTAILSCVLLALVINCVRPLGGRGRRAVHVVSAVAFVASLLPLLYAAQSYTPVGAAISVLLACTFALSGRTLARKLGLPDLPLLPPKPEGQCLVPVSARRKRALLLFSIVALAVVWLVPYGLCVVLFPGAEGESAQLKAFDPLLYVSGVAPVLTRCLAAVLCGLSIAFLHKAKLVRQTGIQIVSVLALLSSVGDLLFFSPRLTLVGLGSMLLFALLFWLSRETRVDVAAPTGAPGENCG